MRSSKKMYFIAFFLLGIYILLEVLPYIQPNEIIRLILLCGCCLFMYIGGIKLSKEYNNTRPMKVNLWIFFIIYLILLITLTLFDPMWGRHGINYFIDTNSFKYYIDNAVNIVPFRTISIYIKNLSYNALTKENILYNLVGNFICLMPLSLFLPLLFKRMRKFKNFIKAILFTTFSIEIIQFITTSGSCDIDDIILNSLGAIILYLIVSIKIIKKTLFKIFLKEDINE